ncbi:MAG: alpha/beta fold hydrolase [Treponema sp.]|nr:alpha/beta fold hydrolase [Treponema sp.]
MKKNWKAPAALALFATITALTLACGTAAAVDGHPYLAEPIVIGAGGEWALDGILTLPSRASARNPVPAVVLVHGSGPADMDSTIFGNRPFLDIASHLSANGVAVIRYDKRTYTHGLRMMETIGDNLTTWDESVEDAILAAQLLRADPRIDGNRVYLLGLSMGGMLAPNIHAAGGNFAGLILMAGTPRTLPELMLEQFRTIIALTMEAGPEKDMQLAQMDMLEDLFASIPGMTREEAIATQIPLGMTAYYFKDLEARSFATYIQEVSVPILVMQGGRDFQVRADKDFAMIRELLEGRDNVTFKLYDDLNHIFMHTTATNFIEHAEEMTQMPGRVDVQVLQDIVDWVLTR